MARARSALVLGGMIGCAIALGSLPAWADATVACPFKGKQVRTVVTNSKDGPRSCNAVCVWRYGIVSLRGAGGAMLQSGESKTVYHSEAPYQIDAVVGGDLQCNR